MARQKGNTVNASVPALSQPPVVDNVEAPEGAPGPSVTVEGEDVPVRKINTAALRGLAAKYRSTFNRYASERHPAEQTWLKNLRQHLGVYDPEILNQLPPDRSRAYPRLTRMKCISMLSRLMNLMFPGNEDNWELNASPSPEMSPESVVKAIQDMQVEMEKLGQSTELTQDMLDSAVSRLAATNAAQLTRLIKDQLLELGGDQTLDWVLLNRKVVESGIRYGIGVLEGPYVRKVQKSGWALLQSGEVQPEERDIYKPQYDFLPVWDFYPDMTARTLPGDGYFVRKVMGRSALRKLGNRPDFFESEVKAAITAYASGNFKAKSWENELRAMGQSTDTPQDTDRATGREKYEIIIWKGPVSAETLKEAGADVPESMLADDVEAELWMVGDYIIKADVNAWRKMGVEMRQAHVFSFDEDDTSPISAGLPQIVRDSQLSVCAATRMLLDNASVVCGPNMEVNTQLLRPDQDLTSVSAYKMWYRDDEGLTAQFPAVRRVEIDGHLNELQALVKMFLELAEMETFIGPSTGGDMAKGQTEAFRTAAGGSMIRGDAALPFKDIVRNFDSFTQSVIWSIVKFNRKFNPDQAPEGDYDVIARGATSLIAKEIRGMQIDALAATMTEEERDHIDERRFIEARFASRDLGNMLVPKDEADRRKTVKAQAAADAQAKQDQMLEATVRKTVSEAFKNIAQGQKNAANADQVGMKTALELIEQGEPDVAQQPQGTGGGAR